MDSKGKVLITSPDIHPVMDERLKGLGYKVDTMRSIENDSLYLIIQNYEGIVISSKTIIDKKMIDKAVRLKFIARAGSGMEIVDVDYARSKGIVSLSSPEGNCDAVAEHAMAMLLALLNNLLKTQQEVKDHLWIREENRGIELEGKSVGIVGYGHTGAAFAERLSSFKVNILVYDKYKKDYSDGTIKETTMEELFENCDIISLHLPLTEETKYFADKEWFSKFRKPVFFINTARGKNVKIEDLLLALEKGLVKGACLDVLENEKPETWNDTEKTLYNKLLKLNNVIVTPHIAGWTQLSKLRLATVLANKIASL